MSAALLVFLICVVVGSVVLTAGTVTVRRINGILNSERRYYSVISAAELLRDIIDGNTVSANVKKITETPITVTYDGSGSVTGKTPGASLISYSYDGAENTLLYKAVCKVTMGAETVTNAESAWNFSGDETYTASFTVTPDIENAVEITAELTVSSDGEMVIKLYNTDGTEKYTAYLTLTAQKESFVGTNIVNSDMSSTGTDTGFYTETKTETKTNSITWKVKSISDG